MQFELFSGSPINDNNVIAGYSAHQYEITLYANDDDTSRDLVINSSNDRGRIVFSHIDDEQDVNVIINGNVEINGNLSVTGSVYVNHVSSAKEICHNINGLNITYDTIKNEIRIDDKIISNYYELGYLVSKALKRYQENNIINDVKDFFNY